MTLPEWLAGVGALVGAAVASYLTGSRKRDTSSDRSTVVPMPPPAPTPSGLEARLEALEAARAKDVAERDAKVADAAKKAAAKELRALIQAAAKTKRAPKETDDDRRSEDPPTDP